MAMTAFFKCVAVPLLLVTATVAAAAGKEVDYSTGVFVVNEDWYGHQNSTVNYLLPDEADGEYWHYRVVQSENPGMELGCTNQYGAIWKDRFYLIAKQEKDPGASVAGGRITVCDAKTMKIIHQSALIDPSGGKCDGRAFIGVDDHKGYISTSNGVWILDLDSYEVTGPIEGTANPSPNNIYRSQCGSMVEAGGKVFVAHQKLGLLVIDSNTDQVTDTVSMAMIDNKAGIGSVVKSKDGNIWLSIAKDTNGNGNTLPYLVKVDPETLSFEVINISDGMYAPSNSWYAWTPDNFCASTQNNVLYWAGGESSWFSNQKIYRYDIDRGEQSLIIDLAKDGAGWKLYGCSMRVDPRTDELFMSLYREFNDQTYITRRATSMGETIYDYSMISNYWFPSLFVFPTSQSGTGVDAIVSEEINRDTAPEYYTLQGVKVTSDNLSPGIYICRRGREVTKIRK